MPEVASDEGPVRLDAHRPHAESPVPRPVRRPARMSVTGLIVAALVLGVGLAACSSGSSKSASTSTRPVAVAKSGTTTTLPLVRTATDAAEQLYFAWQRADKPGAAARLASDGAVTSMFAIKTTSAAGLAFIGCSKPASGASTCSWSRHNGKLTMHVSVASQDMPQVQSVALT